MTGVDVAPNSARYARRYCELGLALTWSPPGEKGPRHRGWNLSANAIMDPAIARKYWTRHPDYGIGALLAYSRLVSLDVDDARKAQVILAALGTELDDLQGPRIVGHPERFRLMFRAPNAALVHRTARWPRRDDPKTSHCIFELRAGALSDAMPPTIHVGTGQPYVWAVPPRDGFPPVPEQLLKLWREWPETERQILSLCPWRAPPKPPPPRGFPRRRDMPSVIAAFNAAHDAAAILEAHGYVRRGQRFVAPESTHSAGVVLLDNGKVFYHHAGDSLATGHALDAFDLFAQLAHGGDVRAAIREAARELGMP